MLSQSDAGLAVRSSSVLLPKFSELSLIDARLEAHSSGFHFWLGLSISLVNLPVDLIFQGLVLSHYQSHYQLVVRRIFLGLTYQIVI